MNTEQLLQLDRQHVWHPCMQEKDFESFPLIPIERGEGVYLIDPEGKRYIDGVSSWWVNIFGHNHPRLNQALIDQSQKIAHHIFTTFTHQPAVELATRLAEVTPGNLTRTFFADNGSSAVEAALKMSFQFWQQSGQPQKTRFLSITDAYHGETVGALSVSGCDLYKDVYRPMLMEGYQAAGPDCYRCPYQLERKTCNAECFENLEAIVEQHHSSIAGVIIEPLIQCAAGMRIFPPIYLKKLRSLCDRYAIHYIADEIAVGFGRTGKLFANEHAQVAPDLMCLSKGITGGYLPLSVVITTDEIYQAFYDEYETLKAFLHSHSYTGNPLACALAVETLSIFKEEKILQQLPEKMALIDAYRPAFEALDHVGEVRRCGMVTAIELVEDKARKTPYPWQQRKGLEVYSYALEQGALLRPLGNVVYFMPPLTINAEEMERLLEIALAGIKKST